jgi:hypothetical protein
MMAISVAQSDVLRNLEDFRVTLESGHGGTMEGGTEEVLVGPRYNYGPGAAKSSRNMALLGNAGLL